MALLTSDLKINVGFVNGGESGNIAQHASLLDAIDFNAMCICKLLTSIYLYLSLKLKTPLGIYSRHVHIQKDQLLRTGTKCIIARIKSPESQDYLCVCYVLHLCVVDEDLKCYIDSVGIRKNIPFRTQSNISAFILVLKAKKTVLQIISLRSGTLFPLPLHFSFGVR